MKIKLVIISVLSVALVSGCGGRYGHLPYSSFVNPKTIGTHNSSSERQGMLYTLRGGHIDLAHVRGPADQTKKAYERAYSCIVNGKKSFTVSPAWERITNKVEFDFPADWEIKPETERRRIAREIALKVGPLVGYNSSLYHEMLTWKGAKFLLIDPQFKSSFSWEDLYSQIMGVWVAKDAIKAGEDFDVTFTRLLNQELKRLEVVPREKAKQITESVRGKWYTSASLMKKNMDSYLDEDVSPCIVPGYTSAEPIIYPLPDLDGIDQYGIKVKYTVSSLFFLENGKLKRIAGTSDALEPLKDFKPIMKHIQREGVEKYGLDIHK
ncbi:MAG: DUF4056 domain-containing protein [Planctomycetota bacterium]|jgi:hypothetical protein